MWQVNLLEDSFALREAGNAKNKNANNESKLQQEPSAIAPARIFILGILGSAKSQQNVLFRSSIPPRPQPIQYGGADGRRQD